MTWRNEPSWALFFTCCLSHIALFPGIIYFKKRRMYFELCVASFTALTSFMYHSSESFRISLFLKSGSWHRLDNIGAISSITITFIHLCFFESEDLNEFLKYFFLFIIVIFQEAAPWNLTYTAIPILPAFLMVLISHYLYPKRREYLIKKKLYVGIILNFLGLICFIQGLDEINDIYRIWHGLFHICIGLGLYNFFLSFKPRINKVEYGGHTNTAVIRMNV